MAKGKRDTKGLKVVSRRVLEDRVVTDFIFSVTGDETIERTNHLIEHHQTKDDPGYPEYFATKGEEWAAPHKAGDYYYTRRTDTRQKLLCVGGPLAGKRVTDAPDYHAYNVAAFNRHEKFKACRCIFVHGSVLKG